jgi:hypothetical protein
MPCGQCRGAYDGDVLGDAGHTALSVLLLVVAIGPVIAMIWFAWWFLRAGKRYDEQERAAGRRPPPGF